MTTDAQAKAIAAAFKMGAEAEREACAKMLEEFGCTEYCVGLAPEHEGSCYQAIAAAIRARK